MFDTIDRIAHDRMNRRISIVEHNRVNNAADSDCMAIFALCQNATQKRDNKSAKTKPREK